MVSQPISELFVSVSVTRIIAAYSGDIMAPVLNNIEQLVQMPYGCGEQNMLTFVPDIVVTQYLNTTQRLTPVFAEKAKTYMESGT